MDISEELTFFAALYKVDENMELGMWLLYLTVVILSVIVFKLGFARKLPLLKNIVIYVFLLIGSAILTIFALFYPVAEVLVFSAIFLLIYKLRLKQEKKQQSKEA